MGKTLERQHWIQKITDAFAIHPVVALLGPRQVGKTTLSRLFCQGNPLGAHRVHFFDLEDPNDEALFVNPKAALNTLSGLIVIDEVQRAPELFRLLRVLVDNPDRQQRFLILGSASRDLIRQSSESLAGRIRYLELSPFSFFEVEDPRRLWIQGGYPRAYLANDKQSSIWRKEYITTFLERDIPSLGFSIPSRQLRRFWMMLVHYHGGILKQTEIGNALGLSAQTIRRYVDILTGTFMIRELQPWFENIEKRQIKTPKIYFRDSGIFHSLLGLEDEEQLLHHPKLGASWEGWILEEVIRFLEVDVGECYFWGIHNQAELDLMVLYRGKRLGFEIKFTDKPALTRSMHIAMADLKLDALYVLYPGDRSFQLKENSWATPLNLLRELL